MSVVKDVDILKNLQSQNTWWTSGTVDQALVPELKRNAYRKVRQVFLNDIRRFPVLSGPRRAGKSTIMFQIIDELLQSGVKPERILFYTFDEFPNDGISINEVVEIYQKYVYDADDFWFFTENCGMSILQTAVTGNESG